MRLTHCIHSAYLTILMPFYAFSLSLLFFFSWVAIRSSLTYSQFVVISLKLAPEMKFGLVCEYRDQCLAWAHFKEALDDNEEFLEIGESFG